MRMCGKKLLFLLLCLFLCSCKNQAMVEKAPEASVPSGVSQQAIPPVAPAEESVSEESAPPKEEPPMEEPPAPVPQEDRVSLSIWDGEQAILSEEWVVLQQEDTVFSVLQRVTRERGIQMEFSGRGTYVYVQGMHQLYEFDRGPESGWIYMVNGQTVSKSAGAYPVKNGDVIVWRFVEKRSPNL